MRFLLVLAIIGLMTYAILDVARTEDPRRRLGLPAWLWVAVIIVTFGVGALIWLLASRLVVVSGAADDATTSYEPRTPRRPARPLAPDDDPEFLAGLNRATSPEPPKTPEPPAITPPPPADPPEPSPRRKPKDAGESDGPRTGSNPGDTEDRA